jgi:hypothetical protein
MLAALRGHYVQFVVFMGVSEKYPEWFIEEIANRIFVNESRFSFWTSPPERSCDYYEKELIETYSIVLRKPNGETHIAEIDTFNNMYHVFKYDQLENGGVAAFNEDVIEYVECFGGGLIDTYPKWFYEYFTEALNNPKDDESFLFSIDGLGHITIKERCVFLRNRFGEIRQMSYGNFLKYYDPRIDDAKYYDPRLVHEYLWEGCPF